MLTLPQAAERIGLAAETLRKMCRLSDRGCLVIRGQSVSIAYSQGGSQGQGRILIPKAEIERLADLMVCRPLIRPPPVVGQYFGRVGGKPPSQTVKAERR